MTAQSEARSVIARDDKFGVAPMKGATTIWQGALVVTESGLAIPGKTGASLTVLGVARETVKNAGADNAANVPFERGTFDFFNYGSDAVTANDVGKDCYIVDDQTVAKTSNSSARSAAGKVMGLEGSKVYVRVGR